MLTALIIANIALTVGLMSMVKQVKKVSKEIEDIGSNLSHIQRNTVEIGNNITSGKNELKKEFQEAHVKALLLPPRWIVRTTEKEGKYHEIKSRSKIHAAR